MNIVLITTWARPDLLSQSILSLWDNAADRHAHELTIVLDDEKMNYFEQAHFARPACTLIRNNGRQGASASRNIGAGSIPKYRRQEHVLFLDDDVYMAPGWDQRMFQLANWEPRSIISGYSHPYNQAEPGGRKFTKRNAQGELVTLDEKRWGVPLVISSVAMMMPWRIFDDVGPWDEPGGPGGSEDYAICMRAKDKGYGFAVTDPQCVIHTGLTSSRGEQIVGYKELASQNWDLIDLYGLRGKVTFA